MNKKSVLKIILLIITIAMITFTSTNVFAADDDVEDLSGSITGGDDTTTEEETPVEQEKTPVEQEKPTETPKEEEKKPTTTYPDKDIPYAGPTETIIMGTLFVACAVVGVYTFLKLSEYSNV